MAKFCPEWVFSACIAKAAGGFLTGNIPLSSLSTKLTDGLNQYYNEIKAESIEEAATKILEFLNEIEAGSTAIEYLNAYIYKRVKFHANNKPRKLQGLFVDEFAPMKTRDYSAEKAVILFKAFVFSSRSGLATDVPAEWEINEEEGIGWFGDLMKSEPTIFDSL
ncbi:MAG: hypothetical protein P8L82_07560 [Paracoccaceae bacterium]|nr:hypothetical protein [Paracoccaceae bacterium]